MTPPVVFLFPHLYNHPSNKQYAFPNVDIQRGSSHAYGVAGRRQMPCDYHAIFWCICHICHIVTLILDKYMFKIAKYVYLWLSIQGFTPNIPSLVLVSNTDTNQKEIWSSRKHTWCPCLDVTSQSLFDDLRLIVHQSHLVDKIIALNVVHFKVSIFSLKNQFLTEIN